MSLKFCTLNVLNEKNIFSNLKCSRQLSGFSADTQIRFTTIINILMSNNFDVIFLQEVSDLFRNMLISNGIYINNYIGHFQNTQAIILKNNRFSSSTKFGCNEKSTVVGNKSLQYCDDLVRRSGKYYVEFSSGTFNSFFIVTARHASGILHLINMHLPMDISNRRGVLTITERYINRYLGNGYCIISGDMNQEETLQLFNSPNNLNFRRLSVNKKTSYSLVKCGSADGEIIEFKDDPFKENDHIYTIGDVLNNSVVVYDDFDKNTYELVSSNTFNTYGAPYCYLSNSQLPENNIANCSIDKYQNVLNLQYTHDKKWPSDHALLSVNLTLIQRNQPKLTLQASAREFVPGSFIRNQQFQSNQQTYESHSGGSLGKSHYEKYKKYKIKYNLLKNKL